VKLVLISDTHEQQGNLIVPDGDVLVHAGDLTFRGKFDPIAQTGRWLRSLPHKTKILCAGNHDFLFEESKFEALEALGPDIIYLENEAVTIDGVKFWGSPVTPWFFDWAFNVARGQDIKRYWDKIPNDTDVLITHGPPKGILDLAGSDPVGCEDLRESVRRVRPKIHVFGHIHSGYGSVHRDGTTFYNASVVDEAYKIANNPWEVEL